MHCAVWTWVHVLLAKLLGAHAMRPQRPMAMAEQRAVRAQVLYQYPEGKASTPDAAHFCFPARRAALAAGAHALDGPP